MRVKDTTTAEDGWDIMRQVWLDWLEKNKVEVEGGDKETEDAESN